MLGTIDAADVLCAAGPAGSGVLSDSSRCLHYGSRGNLQERLGWGVPVIERSQHLEVGQLSRAGPGMLAP